MIANYFALTKVKTNLLVIQILLNKLLKKIMKMNFCSLLGFYFEKSK